MRSMLFAGALTAAISVAAPARADTPLNLGEHFLLRSYTGQAIGAGLRDVLALPSVALIANTSSICSALTGSTASQVLMKLRGEQVSLAATANAEEAAKAAKEATRMAGVAVLYGGQTPAPENQAMVTALLKELAAANYRGAVFFHLAVWAGQMVENAALADETVAKWLAGHDNLFALAVDAQRSKGMILNVTVRDGKQATVRVAHEVDMDKPWLDLFRRSLLRRA